MNFNEAIQWVDKFRPLVEKRIKAGINVLPDDLDDYLQEAYEAALISSKICEEKRISFTSAFWKVIRRSTKRMTRSVDVKDCEEYLDNLLYRFGRAMPGPEEVMLLEESTNDQRDEILAEFMNCLTGNEKDVVAAITGYSGSRMTCQETAAYLGITRGAVSQIIARVIDKARVIRADGTFITNQQLTQKIKNEAVPDTMKNNNFQHKYR